MQRKRAILTTRLTPGISGRAEPLIDNKCLRVRAPLHADVVRLSCVVRIMEFPEIEVSNMKFALNDQDGSDSRSLGWPNTVLWLLTFFVLLYTLHNIYLKFVAPYPAAGNPLALHYYDQARWAELAGGVLLVCSPFLCGLYAARKDVKLRKIFPAVQIPFLLALNLMLFR